MVVTSIVHRDEPKYEKDMCRTRNRMEHSDTWLGASFCIDYPPSAQQLPHCDPMPPPKGAALGVHCDEIEASTSLSSKNPVFWAFEASECWF